MLASHACDTRMSAVTGYGRLSRHLVFTDRLSPPPPAVGHAVHVQPHGFR